MTKANQDKAKARPTDDKSRIDDSSRSAMERVPLGGDRNVLTVEGKDPAFVYRFVLDVSETGGRISRFKKAGYVLVHKEEQLSVGEDTVFRTEDIGSLVTKSESDGSILFLMKQKREWFDADQVAKASALNAQFNEVKNSDNKIGHYGKLEIS